MSVPVPTYVKGFHDEAAVSQMPYYRLGASDLMVSYLGFGGGGVGNHYVPISEADVNSLVRKAISQGINYIDTAPWYGNTRSETVLGRALTNIPREAYYIGTKVGRYEPSVEKMFDFRAERVIRSIDESLARLRLPYVDVIQVHDVEYAKSPKLIIDETLPALQKVVESGKARYIGITGYPTKLLTEILGQSKVPISTVLSYCRLCLADTSLIEHMQYFQVRGVGVISASPVAMGLLSSRGPPAWHPAGEETKKACREASQFCQSRGVELGRLAVHYALSHRNVGVATHLIGFDSVPVLDENLAILRNGLSDLEEKVLQEVQERYLTPSAVRHWEGVEVRKYWERMNLLG